MFYFKCIFSDFISQTIFSFPIDNKINGHSDPIDFNGEKWSQFEALTSWWLSLTTEMWVFSLTSSLTVDITVALPINIHGTSLKINSSTATTTIMKWSSQKIMLYSELCQRAAYDRFSVQENTSLSGAVV